MKKVFATLAAAAMAISMCAFTACDVTIDGDLNGDNTGVVNPDNPNNNNNDNSNGTGTDGTGSGGGNTGTGNGGNNTDTEGGPGSGGSGSGNTDNDGIKPAQLIAILSKIDKDKLFGDTVNLGFIVDLESSIDQGEYLSANSSIDLEYKMSVSRENNTMAGYGEGTIKADYEDEKGPTSIDLDGAFYNDTEYVYAYADGTAMGHTLTEKDKVKINIAEIMEYFSEDDDYLSPSTSTFEADTSDEQSSSVLWLIYLLMNYEEMGVKITADTTDGIELKISLSEDTVWAAIDMALSSNEAETQEDEGEGDLAPALDVETIKEYVTFNNFLFDVYFAIDSDGAFESAKVEMDIDVEAEGALLDLLMTNSGNPDMKATVKGTVDIYTIDETITVPDEVTESEEYYDCTQTLIEMIESMLENDNNGGNDDKDDSGNSNLPNEDNNNDDNGGNNNDNNNDDKDENNNDNNNGDEFDERPQDGTHPED